MPTHAHVADVEATLAENLRDRRGQKVIALHGGFEVRHVFRSELTDDGWIPAQRAGVLAARLDLGE
jgi:hypothetical protein